jgi:hypothetical protein
MCIPPSIARQRLGKYVPAAMNTRKNRQIVGRTCLWVCPCVPFIGARKQLGNEVSAATDNCWGRRLLCGPCRIKGK